MNNESENASSRVSSSVKREPLYVALMKKNCTLYDSVPNVCDSESSNLCVAATLSEPSSNDELAHTDAIKRIRSESNNEVLANNSDSVNSATLEEAISSEVNVEMLSLNSNIQRYSSTYWEKESHYFILSQSGKPIFTRYGDDNQVAAFIGVMQAMVSYVAAAGDVLKSMRAGNHNFVFLAKPNMILVGVNKSSMSTHQIKTTLNFLYNQILSVLTFRSIKRAYEKQPGVDIRRLLIGTDRYLNGIIDFMETDLGAQLNAISCVPMYATLRQSLLNTISQSIKVHIKHLINDLVFAILLLDEELVGVVRRKDQQPHPNDLHLILNLIRNSNSFKIQTCWLPICLPKFDADGYFYAHISYLTDRLSLLFLTVNPDQFDVLQDCKTDVMEACESAGLLEKVRLKTYSIEELLQTNKLLNGDIKQFVYKLRTASQYISYESKDISSDVLKDYFKTYLRLYSFIHTPDRPARLIYQSTSLSTVIAWQTGNFELYATLAPMPSKRRIMETVNKLLDVINKQKNRLFVLISPTF